MSDILDNAHLDLWQNSFVLFEHCSVVRDGSSEAKLFLYMLCSILKERINSE